MFRTSGYPEETSICCMDFMTHVLQVNLTGESSSLSCQVKTQLMIIQACQQKRSNQSKFEQTNY